MNVQHSGLNLDRLISGIVLVREFWNSAHICFPKTVS